jgi:hypothetical protein
MSSDLTPDRPLLSYILAGIVDFVCILMAAEAYREGKSRSAIVWLVAGVLSSLIGYYWPKLKARKSKADLPLLRPKIVPVRYGRQTSDGRYGLFIENFGEPAFDVSVAAPVAFGGAKLVFLRDFPNLTKAQGEVLLESHIEKRPHDIDLGDLFGQMRIRGIREIAFPISYRDGDNNRYLTHCRIERDVMKEGGLAVRFVGQELGKSLAHDAVLNHATPELTDNQVDPTDRLLSYLRIDPEGWFVLPVGTALLQLIRLSNCELANPVTANNVRARISYAHANGRDVFVVPEATWRRRTRTGANEFPSKVFIDSNTEARLVLLGEDQSVPRNFFVFDLQSGSRKELVPGHWNVTVRITADNCAPYIGKGGFTITSSDFHLVYDEPDLSFSYESEAAPLMLSPSDPRIRLETLSVPSDTPGFVSDRFVLHNEGGATAYRVKIEDIDLSSANFPNVAAYFQVEETVLNSGDPKIIIPVIRDAAFSLPGDGLAMLLKWATEPSLAGKNILITYYDYNGNEFKTGAELVYTPLAPETAVERAKEFGDMARQFLRKNPLEVIVQRKERRAVGLSDIAVRNLRYWKVGRK